MPPVHDTKYYYIGKGKLLLSADGVSWDDVGNVIAVEANLEVTELPHFSSRSGLKNRDELITTEQKGTGKYTTDSIHKNNLEKWMMANGITETTQAAVTAGTKDFTTVVLDRWYDIGKVNVSGVVVKDQAETTTYTLDTDYYLDVARGLIMFPSGVTIAAGAEIHITAFDAAETDISTMRAAAVSKKEYHVWFVGDPAHGDIMDIKGYASLKPAAALQGISEEWSTLEVGVEFISHADYDNKPFEIITRGNAS